MNGRQRVIAWATLGVLAVAAFVVYATTRREIFTAAHPDWLDSGQPPEGLAATVGTLTAAESWAANRASHMTASCTGRGAGRRVRRTYPQTLADSPHSFIRANVNLGGC